MDPRDGKIYQTVKMPDDKVWFAQNLNYTKDLAYNPASNVANGAAFTSTTNGVPAIGSYWCPPLFWTAGAALEPASVASGNQSACEVYGALYTWETAMMVDGKYSDDTKTSTGWIEPSASYLATGVAPASGSAAMYNVARGTSKRGICPEGWHVPTVYEWANLLDKVGGTTAFTTSTAFDAFIGTIEGQKIKSQAIFKVNDPNDGSWLYDIKRGTNTTGFSAIPAGYRSFSGNYFENRSLGSYLWSSTAYDGYSAWDRAVVFNDNAVHNNKTDRAHGLTVRCVRD
jgi:uncharacterized protein (TIGR02145 family)